MISYKRNKMVALAAMAITGLLFSDGFKSLAADAQQNALTPDTALEETIEVENEVVEAKQASEEEPESDEQTIEAVEEEQQAGDEVTEETSPSNQAMAEEGEESIPEEAAEIELSNVMPTEAEVNQMMWDAIPRTAYAIPSYNGMKSYESFRALTRGAQGRLQGRAVTNADGFRMIDDRYMIAIGTRFGARTGQYVDLTLANGTVINCVVGDIKNNAHTDATNTFSANHCCSEFIVDTSMIKASVRGGDVSSYRSEWKSPVAQITVYEKVL